jgi:hypothetical protein
MDLSKLNQPKGMHAARLRQRKFALLKNLALPDDALPGNLSLTRTRCGTPSCHCARGDGHPVWQLTFMAEGKKRVERIPAEWVEDVRRRVEAGRAFKDAVAEVLTANAQLLVLEKKQRGRKRKKRK